MLIYSTRHFDWIKKKDWPSLAFENAVYELRISGTAEFDKRIMTFVDNLWGIEVTGGIDQFEPLTIIGVQRSGFARRAGIRLNDVITKINDTCATQLTLREAQMLIRRSGKYVNIHVSGKDETEVEDEFTVDFWFKPRKIVFVPPRIRRPPVDPAKWEVFPWNDRHKRIYKESNCFMVQSKAIERIESHKTEISHTTTELLQQTERNDKPAIISMYSTPQPDTDDSTA